jgi:hypothetical protein
MHKALRVQTQVMQKKKKKKNKERKKGSKRKDHYNIFCNRKNGNNSDVQQEKNKVLVYS